MVNYLQLRWKVDNEERFARTLFVKRRFFLGKHKEENIYYYKEGVKRQRGEHINPLIKIRAIEDGATTINIKRFSGDKEFEVYNSIEIPMDSLEDAKHFLKLSGYAPGEDFCKKISVYTLKNEKYSQVQLHEFKWGIYVKAVDTKETVLRLGKKLGFDYNDRVIESYTDCYRHYILSHGLKDKTKI